jgi:hypothetical protein
MVGHVALVAVAEVFAHVLGPLIGFGQQESVFIIRVDRRAQLLDHLVGFAQVFVVGAFTLDQVGNRIEPEAVDPHVEPETHGLQHRLQDPRIVEIQIRLVAEEAMPEVRLRLRVPGPVRSFGVGEYDARVEVFLVGVAPDVEIALRRARRRRARGLEPGVLIGRVIDDELGDHLQSQPVRLVQHGAKILERTVLRMDILIVGDVVAVVLQGRGIEGHQPEGVDAQIPDIFELGCQSLEIADAVVVRIEERLDVALVDDRVLVPKSVIGIDAGQRGGIQRGRFFRSGGS